MFSYTLKRLRILGAEEIDALNGEPRFTPEERQEHFTLSPPERAALECCKGMWLARQRDPSVTIESVHYVYTEPSGPFH